MGKIVLVVVDVELLQLNKILMPRHNILLDNNNSNNSNHPPPHLFPTKNNSTTKTMYKLLNNLSLKKQHNLVVSVVMHTNKVDLPIKIVEIILRIVQRVEFLHHQ